MCKVLLRRSDSWKFLSIYDLYLLVCETFIFVAIFKALIDSVDSDNQIDRMMGSTMLSLLVLWGRGHGASLSRLPRSLFGHWLSAWPSLALALSAVETLQYGWRRGRGGPMEPCITCPSDRLPHVNSHHISSLSFSLCVSFCLFSHLSASNNMALIHKSHCAQLGVMVGTYERVERTLHSCPWR